MSFYANILWNILVKLWTKESGCIRQALHMQYCVDEPLDPVSRGCTSILPIKIRGSNHNRTQVP